jgi:DNA-binding transcriptional regulator GbsR (MarR family)
MMSHDDSSLVEGVQAAREKLTPPSMQMLKALAPLAMAVGDFIAYWGFRAIHGQIWALMWLSKKPLNGIECAKSLGVSKALISNAFVELQAEGLIMPMESENARTKRFTVCPDVYSVIQGVLRRRELALLSRADGEVRYLDRQLATNKELSEALNPERLESLKHMVSAGNQVLMMLAGAPNLVDVVTMFSGQGGADATSKTHLV